MRLDRRAFLRLAGMTAALVGSAGCAPLRRLSSAQTQATQAGLLSLGERVALERMCFGVTATEIRRVLEIGLVGWIEEQLSPDSLPELELRWRLRNLEALDKDADELEGYKRPELIGQLRQATLLRRVFSRYQLHEMMVEFWTDHFNISVEKGDCWFLKVVDDREVIRPNALGKFEKLLHASATSPAMLVYLDNQANHPAAPNENYARELLELHTLGIDGGYNQEDIRELARSLTGWTVKDHFWPGRFHFDEELHDQGVKHLLDNEIQPKGKQEVEGVLAQLAAHPSTSRHIAIKIVRRFICDDPEKEAPNWVKKTQEAFHQSGGDIHAALRPLLLDGLARAPGLLGLKMKRPVDFIVSSLRVCAAETDGGRPLHAYLGRMGQALFAWPTPDGPPDVASHWMTNLSTRWNFSLRLVMGGIQGTNVPIERWLKRSADRSSEAILEELSSAILGASLPRDQGQEIQAIVGELSDENRIRAMIAGLIASPAFQYR